MLLLTPGVWSYHRGGWRLAVVGLVVWWCCAGHLTTATPLDPVQHQALGLELNSWIRYFEPARYDSSSLGWQHKRSKRSLLPHVVRLNISGHGRVFKLRLTPDRNVFAEDVVFESTGGPVIFDPGVVYTGTLEDDDTAQVHGLITNDGFFEGTITTTLDDFHIEPVSRYITAETNKLSPPFHSIVYKSSDVNNPTKSIPCASHLLHQKHHHTHHRSKRWLLEAEAKQPFEFTNNNNTNTYWHPPSYKYPRPPSSTTTTTTTTNSPYQPPSRPLLPPLNPLFDLNHPYNNQPIEGDDEIDMTVSSGNRTYTDVSGLIFRNVNKRATIDPKKTTCMLYLQADHQFFQKYGTEEACIEVMTRHVQRVNAIYRSTDFNQDGRADNITFMVKRIKVHTAEALKDPLYRFPNNYGVEKFLELFSEEDYDAFCLAYMFTYRDFEMGTLGLAWTGDLKNAGGVCEKNGHYRGSMKSLNTGIVTLLNYGKHVPPAVSHVTLAHEIGHNFGSPHDPETCTPGGDDGNFIMFARATSGDKKNNNQFSPCSLKSINPVLNFKARSPKGCFTEPQASLCGNGVVEEGEECDCGWEEDCRDQCCFPQRRYAPVDETPCRLTPRSACSPSQGPCCTAECQVKFGDKCRDDNGCRDASFCNGRGPQCPPSVNKPNKTICNKEFVCFMGECTGSICLAYGLESCQCRYTPGGRDPPTKACELCCKLPGDTNPCRSSFAWNDMPYDIPDMHSKPGTPCNDYSGYCDVFQVCREVDPSGPLATLRKLLLSGESIAGFKKWVLEYWWVVAGVVIAVLALLILSTKLLGKQSTRTKLKHITIIHSQHTTSGGAIITTEPVRLPANTTHATDIDPITGAAVTVYPAIRSKLPLKRKVRDGKLRRNKQRSGGGGGGGGKEVNHNNNGTTTSGGGAGGHVTSGGGGGKGKVSPKKKKRVSAPVGAEERGKKTVGDTAAVIEIPSSKVKKLSGGGTAVVVMSGGGGGGNGGGVGGGGNKKKKKKKEVIDYSGVQHTVDGAIDKKGTEVVHNQLSAEAADSVGKVQNWLLRSQAVSSAALPKSKSTPAGLVEKTAVPVTTVTGRRSPHKRPTLRPRTDKSTALKSHSIANLPGERDKVRLQVVYKPPFKFSVKLRKPDKSGTTVTTTVPNTNNNNNNVAKRTTGAAAVTPKTLVSPSGGGQPPPPLRTGVLVRQVPREKDNKDTCPSSNTRKVSAHSTNKTVTGNNSNSLAAGSLTVLTGKSGDGGGCDNLAPSVDIDSNIHTVQSDLEVLLSESEFLFSDD